MDATLLVVKILGAVLLLSLGIIGLLAGLERESPPDVLLQVPGLALAGLLGMLAPRPDLSVTSRDPRPGAHARDDT